MNVRNARLRPLVWAGLLVVFAGCVNHDRQLVQQLAPVLHRHADSGAVVRARVIELPSGRELYACDADVPCTPASNMKLLTTAAGLDMFGPNHAFKTYLAIDGDDLWLIGTGDPATGDPRLAKAAQATPIALLEQWAKLLKKRGITEIKGDLIYDDSALESDPRVHPTWPQSWLPHWYAAPVAGLNFYDNNVDITIWPTAEGQPVRYEVMPPVQNITVINECVSGSKGEPTIEKRPEGNIYKLGGICTQKEELKSKPVDDPGAFFADALRTQLAAQGITVVGQTRRATAPLGGTMPPPSNKVIAVNATPIRNVLARINKNSQNMFAECLCKMTGQQYEAKHGRHVPGSWKSGGEALRAFLKRNGINDRALAPMDGSGLSPDNRLSARILTEMLAVMWSRPDREVYRVSLSAVGVDGSLAERMTDLKGHVFGKTGYIGGVSSCSGYLQTHEGKWLAFSFVYNNTPDASDSDDDAKPYMALQDEACHVLYHWPHRWPVATQPTAANSTVK